MTKRENEHINEHIFKGLGYTFHVLKILSPSMGVSNDPRRSNSLEFSISGYIYLPISKRRRSLRLQYFDVALDIILMIINILSFL